MSEAERKVWRAMPAGTAEAIAGLSGSELRTLLLAVARERARAEARLPARHLACWQQVLAPVPGARVRYTVLDSPDARGRQGTLRACPWTAWRSRPRRLIPD